MHDIQNERNLVKAIQAGHKIAMNPQRELLGNLQEWGEHFRSEQHGVTLTILRAKKMLSDITNLLSEAYVFIGMHHENLQPWRRELDNWKNRVEEETGWNHFEEARKFEKNLEMRNQGNPGL